VPPFPGLNSNVNTQAVALLNNPLRNKPVAVQELSDGTGDEEEEETEEERARRKKRSQQRKATKAKATSKKG
jgi:hypothetical protein